MGSKIGAFPLKCEYICNRVLKSANYEIALRNGERWLAHYNIIDCNKLMNYLKQNAYQARSPTRARYYTTIPNLDMSICAAKVKHQLGDQLRARQTVELRHCQLFLSTCQRYSSTKVLTAVS